MSRKLLMAPLGLATLTILAGTAFAIASSSPPAVRHKPVGLTTQSIANAREAGAPSHLVTMNPQSSVALLEHEATKLGAHASDSRIEIIVGLKLRNVAGLKAFLEQVQTPASPLYRQWLTPERFTRLYGPTEADVAQVVAFLKARGITVKRISPNRTLIHTEATTKVYNHAFGIEIDDYKLNGRRFYSTTDRPKLPRTIAPQVTNILGLNHGVQMQPLSRLRALGQVSPQAAPPPSTAYFNPHQIVKAYDWPDITDPANGAGVSIAILTAQSPNVAGNTNFSTFWSAYGLSNHTINVTPVGGDSESGGEGETALDIEWSGAMAPGAELNVYVAANAAIGTFVTMFNQFANDNNSEVMTISWGASESSWGDQAQTAEQIFMQAAAQGISMFGASGDWGADNDSGQANMALYPSSSEYITSANGTELTIADVSGTYGSEHAWIDTGGAISRLVERPDWQVGPGMPTDFDMRMNSDMAMNAGPLHPFVVRVTAASGPGYYGFYGTSAVSPIFAGLFAIAVSQQPGGERLGQSNKLIYDAINAAAQNYAEDFRDILEGCNGYLPDGTTESCAKAGWDHPTGLGSPRATSLLADIGSRAPAGTLVGTVTAGASGAPIAGAVVTVNPGGFTRATLEGGSYSINLLVGDYTVTVSAFGYESGTASASIADGQTTSQDLALVTAPLATLSGTVTDGSGHGYPLYAGIRVSTSDFGQVALVWSDPETGKYSVELPKGSDYHVMATAAFNGYNSGTADITLTANQTQSFALSVTATCTAPGYTFSDAGGFSQDFNGDTFPPAGWTVTNAMADGPVIWELNSAWNKDNVTGGTGTAADADSAAVGSGSYDTSLVTPLLSVSSLPVSAILRYKANYIHLADALDLDISADGGATWTTLSHWTTDHGARRDLPGFNAELALPVTGTGNFQLRWHYYSNPGDGGYNWYAMIDDVVIGACQPIPGGLILGQVTDANTGKGIVGAHVKDDQGAITLINPADPNLPAGTYEYFAAAGARTLTATAVYYSPATAQVNMSNNAVIRRDFALKTGSLAVDPDHFTLHVKVGAEATRTLTIMNTGKGTATFHVISVNAPPPTASASGERNPVIQNAVENPAWMKASIPWLRARANAKSDVVTLRPASGAVVPHDASWVDIAPYPVPIGDNTAAYDPATGEVYTMGGFNADGVLTRAFVYDPGADSWAPIADAPVARAAAASAFVNGKYYVFNGWDASSSNPTAEVDIYEPADETWGTGTPNPVPTGGGSAIAVVNGLVYLIGGCNDGSCSAPLSAVQVYDSALDSWSSAADYPESVTFAACGGIRGKLYCAGGVVGGQLVTAGFVYDPAVDSWAPIADIPVVGGMSGTFYTSANGLLLLSGGFANQAAISNQGVAYDPITNSWIDLPPANVAVARGGGACGFYEIGGITAVSSSGATLTDYSEQLLRYDQQCGKQPSIPWLTVAPNSGTVDAGGSATVVFTFNGAGQQESTTSKAYVSIANNTPYGALVVPLTVSWEQPQPVDLGLSGEAAPDPLPKGSKLTYTLTVENRKAANHGAATGTTLTYELPEGVSYLAANGDASCSAPTTGTVSCDFGTIGLGASKTATIEVEVTKVGALESTFKVSANQPDSDPSTNTTTIDTTVVEAMADVTLSTSNVNLSKGAQGEIVMTVGNAGPDTARDVVFKVRSGASAPLSAATSGQGSCAANSGGYFCELDDVEAGANITIKLTVMGAATGTASVQGQVTTSSDDPNPDNNVVTATVTIKSAGDGGGGALGWLMLAVLLGLGMFVVVLRRQRWRHSVGS